MLAKRGEFEPGMELVKEGALAGARARPDGRGRRRLPAPRHRLRDRGRLRERAGGADERARPLPDLRRPRARGGLRRLHGLRAARARGVAAGARALPRADRRPRGRRRPDDRRRRARLHPRRPRRARPGPPAPDRRAESARRLDIFSMQVDCAASLALVADFDSDPAEALERCRFVLARWEQSEDHHYAVWGLRLAASLFAQAGLGRGGARLRRGPDPDRDQLRARRRSRGARARAGRDRAAPRASRSWPPSSSAARSSSTASCGSRPSALRSCTAPGSRWPPPGERELAIERHAEAYRLARKLAARPLAGRAAAAIEDARRVGRAAPRPRRRRRRGSPLSRRELEVVRLVAERPDQPEIAASSSSARARSTCTSATSSPSSTAAPASRRASRPARPACSSHEPQVLAPQFCVASALGIRQGSPRGRVKGRQT